MIPGFFNDELNQTKYQDILTTVFEDCSTFVLVDRYKTKPFVTSCLLRDTKTMSSGDKG